MKSLFWILGLNLVALLHYSAFLGLLQTHGVTGIGVAEGNSTCPVTEFMCGDGKCIILSWNCDTHADCLDGKDEEDCPDTTCAEDEFRCNDGECIPLRWSCDNDTDCHDGSDENHQVCTSRTCGPNQFPCDSGVCIPAAWKCDGTSDCREVDGEDERNCTETKVCEGDMFQCKNGRCITEKWVCDEDNDCMDGSDEEHCPPPPEKCEENQFRCDDGTCISEDWRCDDEFDCNNHTDELNCPTDHTPCTAFQFQCNDTKQCIHSSWQCDGDPDCTDESDEKDCVVTCSEGHFLCTEGKYCLANSLQCDGNPDCQDGSDELNCTTPSVCSDDEFSCGVDSPVKCIPLTKVCDRNDDCGNEADEEPFLICHVNPCDEFNGGCEHICVNKFRRQHECKCRPGYQLAPGSLSNCTDINECENNEITGTCSQKCINKKGSYKCECYDHYTIENHRYCKADESHPLLLLANKKDLRSIHLETFKYQLLLDNDRIHEAIAMDFHFTGKKFYWTDVQLEQILRADFDNASSVEVIVNEKVHTPDGLAVDWINNHIYWTDTGLKKIEVAALDGSMRKVLIKDNLGEPRAIVLDPNNGYVYWTDWGSKPKIERCTMSGENRKVIVSTDIIWPNGLTIDYEGKRLYWMDAKLHKIESTDLDGSNRNVVLTSHQYLKRPFAITVFEDFLYWTDGRSESVFKYSKFSHGKVESIALNLHAPMDVQVFHPYRQQISDQGKSFCGENKQGCSHFCFPNPLADEKYSCGCQNGFTLAADGHSCVEGGATTGHETTSVQPTLPDSDNRSRNNGSSGVPETTTPFAEITTEGHGYTLNPVNHTTENTPQRKDEENMGEIAGIVIAVLAVVIIIAAVVCIVLYRRYSRNHGKSMNFDNPVYRKTTTDELIIEKNGVNTNLPDSRQPLTQPSNEIV